MLLDAVFHVVPFVEYCTTYAVREAPPDDDGAAHRTVIAALLGVSRTERGADGTVRGFVLTLADAGDFPAAFTAITRT